MNAARSLKEAAEVINNSPTALQLRYLQTLNFIAAEKGSTIIFPIPMDMMGGMGSNWVGYMICSLIYFCDLAFMLACCHITVNDIIHYVYIVVTNIVATVSVCSSNTPIIECSIISLYNTS